MLKNWEFNDEKLNSGILQINRQKSALGLDVISIDEQNKTGEFLDKRNGNIKTSLTECECNGFNFSGKSKRKTF